MLPWLTQFELTAVRQLLLELMRRLLAGGKAVLEQIPVVMWSRRPALSLSLRAPMRHPDRRAPPMLLVLSRTRLPSPSLKRLLLPRLQWRRELRILPAR
jgi:hypothetical protein